MMIPTFKPTKKQHKMFEIFQNKTTTELLWGGSAGSAKSYGVCALIILKCLEYPGIRIGLGRNELTTLKKTTVISFLEVVNDLNISDLIHFNSTAGIITFSNGSVIVLVELNELPSDPEYTRLGGQLFTFGVIDEVGEVSIKGYNAFKARLGRWRNEEFDLKPILIATCNPTKNWIYKEFYKKQIANEIEPYKLFVQALPTDNPYLPQSYLDNLATLPYIERERLLYGNWEYSEMSDALMTYENIINIFENIVVTDEKESFITADIAFTSDKMVIILWKGLVIQKIYVNPTKDNNIKIEDFILELARDNNIPNQNIAFDSDGVGQVLIGRLRNSKAIINNGRPLLNENFMNLKTQLNYKLADLVNSFELKCLDIKWKEEIIEELQQVRYKESKKEGKLAMVDKGEVKRYLNRSPDFSDAISFRMIFEIKPTVKRTFGIPGKR